MRHAAHSWRFHLPVALLLLGIESAVAKGAERPETSTVAILRGGSQRGTLAEITEGEFVVAGSAGTVRAPLLELVQWGQVAPLRSIPYLVLPSGGWIAAEGGVRLLAGTDQLTVPDRGWPPLPIEQAAGILWVPPRTPEARDPLIWELAHRPSDRDRLTLIGGDELAGRLVSINADSVSLEQETGTTSVSLRRLRSMQFLFNAPQVGGTEHRYLVGLDDGSLFVATQVALDHHTLRATVFGWGTLSWRSDRDECPLVLLQPLADGIVYLSDQNPVKYAHVPLLQLSSPYQRDRNVLGGFIRIGGQLFAKGLGVMTASRIEFELAGTYDRFQATVGIDSEAAQNQAALVRVSIQDRNEAWTIRYEETCLGGTASGASIDIDIRSAQSIALEASYADQSIRPAVVNWANARLISATKDER